MNILSIQHVKLAVAFALLVCQNVSGQTLIGNVKNAENLEGVPFCSVYIVELETGVVSDATGQFRFDISLPQKVTLKLSASGYETTVVNVRTETSPLVFYLKEKHMELDEVIVSNAQSSSKRFNVAHIESRKLTDLKAIPVTGLSQALENIPGVYSASSGPGITKPVIRGMQGIRVVTMLNGLRVENQQWGNDHGLAFGELGIGNVEVIKGPSSLLFGADALGGVIFFSDEAYANINTGELALNTQFESATLGNKTSILLKNSGKKWRFNLGGMYTDHADYRLPNGLYAFNSRFGENALKASVGTSRKNWSSHLRFNLSNARTGIVGDAEDSLIESAGFIVDEQLRKRTLPLQIQNNHLISWENKWFNKRSEWMLLTGQTFNQLMEFEESESIPGVYQKLSNTYLNFRFKYFLKENWSLVAGTQSMLQINTHTEEAEEQLIPDANLLDGGVYALSYLDYRKWSFQLGTRFDLRHLNSSEEFKGQDPVTRLYRGANYSYGMVWTGRIHSWKLNLSSGFRAPHLSELLANGFHHGAVRYEIGNVDLVPEKANQLDLTYELNGDHVSLIANPFGALVDDYIYLQPQDSIIEGLPVFEYKQVDRLFMYGADLSLHYHPHFAHWLHWESSFSTIFMEGRNGINIPLVPQTRISTLVKVNFDFKSKFRLDGLLIQHSYLFDQNRVGDFETPSNAYNLINLALQAIIEGEMDFVFKAGVRNLLNKNYIDHLSGLKNIQMPNSGINFYLSASFKLKYTKKS